MCNGNFLFPKKPLTQVSKRAPGHGKRALERGWQKRLAQGWRKVGEGMAKGWHRVGEGLAKGKRYEVGVPPNSTVTQKELK